MVLEGGLVIQEGTHVDLLRHPKSSYIAEMTGVNRLEGLISAWDRTSGVCQMSLPRGDGTEIVIDGCSGLVPDSGSRLSVGERATAVIHPRHVTLSPDRATTAGGNTVSCVISQVTPVSANLSAVGNQMEGLMRVVALIDPSLPTLAADVTIDSSTQDSLPEGATVNACFDQRDVMVFMDERSGEGRVT
jgi:hypothetical protein